MKKVSIILFLIITISLVGVVDFVLAQQTGPVEQEIIGDDDTEIDNPIAEASIPLIVGRIIKAFLGIIGSISLVMFIYAGLLLLTAAGKSEQINKGRQTMVWASLGILIVFASYAILRFVFSAFGL